MSEMPSQLEKMVADFIVTLAYEAGIAIEEHRPPPGDSVDDPVLRYSIQVDHEPAIIEYTVLPEIREIRVPVLVGIR